MPIYCHGPAALSMLVQTSVAKLSWPLDDYCGQVRLSLQKRCLDKEGLPKELKHLVRY